MNRRATTFGVAVALLVALLITARLINVPYVILSPGPVTNTLGNVPGADTVSSQPGGPVVEVSGPTTYPTNGRLDLTTVYSTNCGNHPSMWRAVRAWFNKTETVEPEQVECPPNESTSADQAQSRQEMTQSQSDAVTAALFQLGYKPTSEHITVNANQDASSPANDVLLPGDEILAINGASVTTLAQIHAALTGVKVGSPIKVTYSRDGRTTTVSIDTVAGSDGTAVGFVASRTATFAGVSVKIGIDPNVIGGPSAGTALALAIIDKLTPGGLTGGRTIAGTGTVDGFGIVGPIGGIQQKIAAAVHAKATVFFAPADECHDAKAAAPKSLTLVSIKTLGGAVSALKAIKAGSTNFPHC